MESFTREPVDLAIEIGVAAPRAEGRKLHEKMSNLAVPLSAPQLLGKLRPSEPPSKNRSFTAVVLPLLRIIPPDPIDADGSATPQAR